MPSIRSVLTILGFVLLLLIPADASAEAVATTISSDQLSPGAVWTVTFASILPLILMLARQRHSGR